MAASVALNNNYSSHTEQAMPLPLQQHSFAPIIVGSHFCEFWVSVREPSTKNQTYGFLLVGHVAKLLCEWYRRWLVLGDGLYLLLLQ